MEAKNITLEDVKEAYGKLKTYVYYDNFNLSLRMKLAKYENMDDLDRSLTGFLKSLQENSLSNSINKISTYILPKKVKQKDKVKVKENNYKDSISDKITIVRNDISKIKGEITLSECDYNHYIDAPIEVYLIDVLWIMKEGLYLINNEIKDNCYGNVLVFDKESEEDNPPIRKGTYLFERYYDKYQKWRDNGLKIAREQINSNNSVLLTCLDIQRFYPTSQIDFSKVKNTLKKRDKSSKTELTDLLEEIYNKYQSILTEQKLPQIPIGLLSSGVLANWYLNDFDIAIKERFNPVYYGRYVDDIFMVLANVKPEDSEDWFDKKFLYGDNSPLKKDNNNDYKLTNYDNLKINSGKLKLFYFSPEYPIAVLDNFQKRLDENSSAFWFLPEDDESTDSLNNEGFDIVYEDSINKFREISGIKNSKYGVSVFLAKQIKREIICKDSDRHKIKDEIFKYFKETTLLDMYSLWEKVFTYFVVTNDKKSFSMFRKMIEKAISQLRIENDSEKSNSLCRSLISYCKYCMTMAKALNTDFQDEEDKDLTTYLRKTYLIRQHYLPLPIIIYTRSGIEEKNLVSNDIYTSLTQSTNNFCLNTDEDSNKHPYPRKIHAHEICMLKLFEYIRTFSEKKIMNEDEYIGKIIKELKDYKLGDDKTIPKTEKRLTLRKSDNKTVDNPKIAVEIPKISFKDENAEDKQKIKVALSNIKINNKDIIESIKGKSILNSKKRQRHFKLLNMATQENANCLILPETSMPIELLVTYAEHSRRKQQLVILGIEHVISHNYCFNFSVVFLPYVYKGKKEVFILPRLKNHYSPNECKEVLRYNHFIPSTEKATYHLINWKGIQFTVFNCYELADVLHRSLFRSHIDILFAIEYNKDTYYYSNIVESTCRDLHCYFIQANTSDYGDSRLSIPKKHDYMTPVKIKGGDNDTIITFDVDIEKLRAFQVQNPIYQNKDEFKNTPPGFDSKNVSNRKIEN